MLEQIGLDGNYAGGDSAAIIVGPNGAGKSYYLLDIAKQHRKSREVTVISNTVYGRLNNLRHVKKYTAGKFELAPGNLIKDTLARSFNNSDSQFYKISTILEFCGYDPAFGFIINSKYGQDPHKLDTLLGGFDQRFVSDEYKEDLNAVRAFLLRWEHGRTVWIDARDSIYERSLFREFAAVLRCENVLKRAGVISGIDVLLSKYQGALNIELSGASSGELSLICSLMFLATNVNDNGIVIIDEPENSLHPAWQREYFSKVMGALAYRNVAIIIATHSPLLVTGALNEFGHVVSVYQMVDGLPRKLDLNTAEEANSGIEEILWEAFDVVTPSNHFVSEKIVAAIKSFERKEIDKESVLNLISTMNRKSFDAQQRKFFSAVIRMVDKVDASNYDRFSIQDD